MLACKLGTNLATRTEVVEQAALLIVSSLRRHEVIEAGYGVERGDGASPVAGNAVLGMADEESEMELVQDFGGHDGGISRFGFCGVGIGRRLLHGTIGLCALGSIGNVRQGVAAIGANTTLDLHQRGSDGCGLAVRGRQVVGNVLDEDAFALIMVSTRTKSWRRMQQCSVHVSLVQNEEVIGDP